MAFLLGGANSVSGYEVSNSLRWNNPSDDNLAITFGSAGNRRIFTISAWVKRGLMNDDHALIGQGGTASGNPRGLLFFDNSLRFTNNTAGNSTDTDVNTNAKTRDPAAWYHVVAAVDTTQSTNTNRVKLYINGVHQTSLATATYPDEDFEMNWNNAVLHTVGRYPNNDSYHMDGYISEFYFIDGTQYAASDFGEYDGDSGIWIPKNAKGALTFGDNGFYLEFKQTGTDTDASGMGADTSGEDNHLAVNNLTAVDVTTDTPTNNFCTLSPLAAEAGFTFSEGNTTSVSSTNNTTHGSTFAVSKGKWYWEVVAATHVSGFGSGIVDVDDYIRNIGYESVDSYLFNFNGDKITVGTVVSLFGNISNEGHLMYALDLDNGRFSFGLEGTWSNGSATQSTTFNTSNFDYTGIPDHYYYIARAQQTTTGTTARFNFGNPPLAAMGNGLSDENGYGNFKTAVPSGYYALCTKNLAEYG
jgi:hypothetical protein